MADLFVQILNMSISASWLILAVLVLRVVLRKAPRRIFVWLWGLVAFRLICPFTLESTLSLLPSGTTISPDIMTDAKPAIYSGVTAINNVVNPVLGESFAPNPAASANPMQIWMLILAIIWITGCALMLVYLTVSYIRLRRQVSTAVKIEANLFQSERISSPFVLGIVHPKIYLPFLIEEKNKKYVVVHEQMHIRRGDHFWKLLGFLLLAVYWFHPLVWLSYVLLCRDIELACDERVIEELGMEQKADYSQALLTCSTRQRRVSACPLAFGEVGVKKRVKTILHYQKPAFWIVLATMVVCAGVAVCFLTNPYVPSYHFSDNLIVEASTQDLRAGQGASQTRKLSQAQIEELQSRLQGLNHLQRSRDVEDPALYSLAVQLTDGTAWSFDGYSNTEDRVYTQYEGKTYQVGDQEFCRYLSNICANGDVASAQPTLTPDNAQAVIAQTLSTLTMYEDDTISFTLPEQLPVSQDGKTHLTISLNATFATEPGTYSVQSLLDWEMDWQEGERYHGTLDTDRGELVSVMLRVAFMTEEQPNTYQEYAANFVELTAPFSYAEAVGYEEAAVEVQQGGGQTLLGYTFKSGQQVEISLQLPDGTDVRQSQEPWYDAPALDLLQAGEKIGTLRLYGLGTTYTEDLRSLQTGKNELPMKIFATVALSNHAGYEDYHVQKSSSTGACATAHYFWQDLTQAESGAAADFQRMDCVLAYDWAAMPYFVEITVAEGMFSQTELSQLAQSLVIQS
ncbi:MAG: M56 family metallopeptidase [Eubacteriales bacterium]